MRRLTLFALLLVLAPVWAHAQGIRFTPPTPGFNGTSWTLTNPLLGTSANFVGPIGLGNTTAAPYAYLYAPAANTLALRNSTNAQALWINNTWTDASNYERGSIDWTTTANGLTIATAAAGTGTARDLYLLPGSGIVRSQNFYPSATNSKDLGAGSATWRTQYLQRGTFGAVSKSLTDAAAATAFMTVAVSTNGWTGGHLNWMATSVSGADQLTTFGTIRFAGATTGTTPVCTIGVVGTDLAAVSGGVNTLVCTWTNVVVAQTCALYVTCTNDLAGTQAITLYGRMDMPIQTTLTFP
jgi:hypothetical protein